MKNLKTTALRLTLGASVLLGSLLLVACNREGESTAVVASTTIGTDLDDSVITSKVRAALLADEYVKSLDVKVETYKGEVMLSGFANSATQIERSMTVTQAVPGVRSVNNKLNLQLGSQTVGNKLDDSVITTGVKSAMLADSIMKSREVGVVTHKGEVQLSGFVDTQLQLSHAEEVAKSVEGVTEVKNNLVVKK